MFSERSVYEEEMDTKLKDWESQLVALQGRIDKTADEERVQLDKELQAAQKEQERARAKLDELKLLSDERWSEARQSTAQEWEEISRSIEKLISCDKECG